MFGQNKKLRKEFDAAAKGPAKDLTTLPSIIIPEKEAGSQSASSPEEKPQYPLDRLNLSHGFPFEHKPDSPQNIETSPDDKNSVNSFDSAIDPNLREFYFKRSLVNSEYVDGNNVYLASLLDGLEIATEETASYKRESMAKYEFEPEYAHDEHGNILRMTGITYKVDGKRVGIAVDQDCVSFYRRQEENGENIFVKSSPQESEITPLARAFGIKSEYKKILQQSWGHHYKESPDIVEPKQEESPSSSFEPKETRQLIEKILYKPIKSGGIWAETNFEFIRDARDESYTDAQDNFGNTSREYIKSEKNTIEYTLVNIIAGIIDKLNKDENFFEKHETKSLEFGNFIELIEKSQNEGGVTKPRKNSEQDSEPAKFLPWEKEASFLFQQETKDSGIHSGSGRGTGMRLTHLPLSVIERLKDSGGTLTYNEFQLDERKKFVREALDRGLSNGV